MAQVEIRNVSKSFGDVKVVDNVNIFIKEGEFLVLLGPSGCGKTTLLRMIAGLEDITSGEIWIGGKVVNNTSPKERNIAMVFQSYALYPHMSVFENIQFPLKNQRMNKEKIREKVEWAAGMFGIEKLLNRKPRQLSGGERQRVAIARAMVRSPNVFLLDEPLSNLDAKLRASAREELQQFQEKVGITTIYVTHDQIEAMGLGDHIAVMSKGKVHQIGTPKEVYNNPADTFVASFMGSPPMNLIEKDDSILGFRPENFVPIDMLNADEGIETLEFFVTWFEDLGSDSLVYGNVKFQSSSSQKHVVSRLQSRANIKIEKGKTYTFAIKRQDLRFFDVKTGYKKNAH
ncbi:MAG: ABC transporter ATP-binding protein [Desulfobacterales bacterium]|nr:ABC transporter ATP-binding protein [Desulfobacterales bacterium]MBF0397538.1 ABC transporter ATP-binding protein [Desulfobacterales bacterium]